MKLELKTEDKVKALELLSNLGYEKYKARDYVSAIVYYKRYIEIDQTNPLAYNMLGYLYRLLSKYENLDLQIEYLKKAVELDPDYEQAIRNLALTYPLIGKMDKALECFLKLFKIANIVDDYLAYAFLNIRLKNFKEGWKYYEYRFQRENEYPFINKPKWEGEKITDKTLLVHYEQGYGDSIQFFRYIEQVKPMAKKIIFRVQDELLELIKNNTKGFEVVGMSTPLEDLSFDYHIPLLSLMNTLDTTVDNIPSADGYIQADTKKAKKYKKEFFNNNCFKIGISWNGTKFGNRKRNIPLKEFYALEKLKNVKIYSLQKGFGAKQLEEIPENTEIIDLGKTFNDFSDTAAAMANLDLFVTSDNSLLNLAGAMGKETFLLLSKESEWRWFFDDEKTAWYDSVKIFKKKNINDSWSTIFNRVIYSLEDKTI